MFASPAAAAPYSCTRQRISRCGEAHSCSWLPKCSGVQATRHCTTRRDRPATDGHARYRDGRHNGPGKRCERPRGHGCSHRSAAFHRGTNTRRNPRKGFAADGDVGNSHRSQCPGDDRVFDGSRRSRCARGVANRPVSRPASLDQHLGKYLTAYLTRYRAHNLTRNRSDRCPEGGARDTSHTCCRGQGQDAHRDKAGRQQTHRSPGWHAACAMCRHTNCCRCLSACRVFRFCIYRAWCLDPARGRYSGSDTDLGCAHNGLLPICQNIVARQA